MPKLGPHFCNGCSPDPLQEEARRAGHQLSCTRDGELLFTVRKYIHVDKSLLPFLKLPHTSHPPTISCYFLFGTSSLRGCLLAKPITISLLIFYNKMEKFTFIIQNNVPPRGGLGKQSKLDSPLCASLCPACAASGLVCQVQDLPLQCGPPRSPVLFTAGSASLYPGLCVQFLVPALSSVCPLSTVLLRGTGLRMVNICLESLNFESSQIYFSLQQNLIKFIWRFSSAP